MKKLIAFLFISLLLFVGFSANESFIDQISSSLSPREKWENDLSSPILDQLLTQKFTYLGRGTQSYVFLSEDQKYVIKFIKMNHLTPHLWLKYLPLPFLDKLRYKKVYQREQRLNQVFDTLHYSYRELKDETGLLFIHINRTKNWNKQVTLIGKKGETFILPLDDVPFIIQEKAELFYSRLFHLIETNDTEGAKSCLRSLLNLIWKRGCKGLIDQDRSISNNFGFVNDKPIQLDIGGLCFIDPDQKLPAALSEVDRISKRIGSRIEKDHPEFLPAYQEVLHDNKWD